MAVPASEALLGDLLVASAVFGGLLLVILALVAASGRRAADDAGVRPRGSAHEAVAWAIFATFILCVAAVTVELAGLLWGRTGLLYNWAITVFLFQLVGVVCVSAYAIRRLLS